MGAMKEKDSYLKMILAKMGFLHNFMKSCESPPTQLIHLSTNSLRLKPQCVDR